ncbi:hypothetical protein J4407_03110 [Candidatus Pacearchaeota archaeon]|nr:hypothetical protein [Candidatus Pacearchaeota archaeon]
METPLDKFLDELERIRSIGEVKRVWGENIPLNESPIIELNSEFLARRHSEMLRESYLAGTFNHISYNSPADTHFGFQGFVNEKNIEFVINKIVSDAKQGKLPSKYQTFLFIDYQDSEGELI